MRVTFYYNDATPACTVIASVATCELIQKAFKLKSKLKKNTGDTALICRYELARDRFFYIDWSMVKDVKVSS
jgi:hypothetical protein